MATDTNHSSPLAVAYARSLLELANERHHAREIGQEIQGLADILAADPNFRDFLANPGIGTAERGAVIERTFKGRLSEMLYNLLRVANEKGRLGILDQIAAAYAHLLDEQLGNVDVEVISAQHLDAEQVAHVGRRVSDLLHKTAIVHQTLDESIIGGLVIKVGDQVLDASIRQQLQSMRQRLLSGVTKAPANAINI